MALISDTRVRAKAKFTSTLTGAVYEIHLIDSEHNNTVTPAKELELDKDGFTLEHGDGDQLKNIMGSSFSMGIMVSDSDAEDLASDIMELQEDRFGVRLYEDEDLMWFGTVYQDGVNIDLQHQPYVFRVTAFDGLGKFKEIASGTPWELDENPVNLASVLVKMLREADPLNLSNETDFLVSAVDLRSDGHGSYNTQFDTLAESTCNSFVPLFYKQFDSFEMPFEGRQWYEVLRRIMFAVNGQIRLMNGSFEVVPFHKMFVATSTQVREFDRDYFELDTNTGNPRTFTGVSYSTRIFGSGFTNTKLQGMTVGFEQAADRVVIHEELGSAVLNREATLANNAATASFVTSETGHINLQFNMGVFPAENNYSVLGVATDKECWMELRAYITTIYNSQTYYWGPFRETSAGSDFGEIIDHINAWDTTERWVTMGSTNYFLTLKTTPPGHAPPYPDFSTYGTFGDLNADELAILSWTTGFPQRGELQTNGNGNPWGVFNIRHLSGAKATISVQLKLVALEKNDNTITSDVDTDTVTLTQSQLQAAGLGNQVQGASVEAYRGARSTSFVHAMDTGQSGLSVLIKDLGGLSINDKRGNAPTEWRAWDGTDWDNQTSNWTDGTGTPDTPLITYLLRKYAQIYQKPVKRPDMSFVSDVNLFGRVVTSAGFPLGSSGEVLYLVLKSKFTGRDNVMDQTWLEYDSNEITNTPVVDYPHNRAFPEPSEPPYVAPGGRDPEDPGLLPEVE